MKGFWNKVKGTDGCWYWQGIKDAQGYGRYRFEGKHWSAHRISAYVHGILDSLDSKLYVLHQCDNPACVNPDHLSVG